MGALCRALLLRSLVQKQTGPLYPSMPPAHIPEFSPCPETLKLQVKHVVRPAFSTLHGPRPELRPGGGLPGLGLVPGPGSPPDPGPGLGPCKVRRKFWSNNMFHLNFQGFGAGRKFRNMGGEGTLGYRAS